MEGLGWVEWGCCRGVGKGNGSGSARDSVGVSEGGWGLTPVLGGTRGPCGVQEKGLGALCPESLIKDTHGVS